jgi:dTDP-4-amino-4,6-dideoxygalactose transaminase
MFYSLPPAGNKISFPLILRAMKTYKRNGKIGQSELIKKFIGDSLFLYLSSGRAALWLTLKALSSLKPERKKVIIPAFTCPAVASAILKADLIPVLCDIKLDNFGYSEESIDRITDENVLAVITVHLFGYPSNIEEVRRHCRKYDIFSIEDAAQAFGNELPAAGTKLGLISDTGFFSFGRGKPLSAIHGGLFVTKSETIYQKGLEIYRSLNGSSGGKSLKYLSQLGCYDLFSSPYLYWIPQGIPSLHLGETIFEPDFFLSKGLNSAAFIIEELIKSIENSKKIRMTNSEWYNTELPDSRKIKKLLYSPYPFHRYPLRMKDKMLRDTIVKELNSNGISGTIFYPCPLNELPGLGEVLQDSNVYANAKLLSDTLITLPVHEGVTIRDLNRVKAVFQKIVQ